MAGVTRVYTYRFKPPGDALTLATAIQKAGELIVKHNQYVLKVDTARDGDDMLMRLTMRGHDQWWIKKRVIYPVMAIFVKAGIPIKDVRLTAVDRAEDARITRPRASDGSSKPLDPDVMVDHSDMGLV